MDTDLPKAGRGSLPVLTALTLLVGAALLVPALYVSAATVRREIAPGVYAHVTNGNRLGLEVHVPESDAAAKGLLTQYLAAPEDWKTYAAAARVMVPYSKLKPPVQRQLLLVVFANDYVDDAGWHHVVAYAGPDGKETLWTLAEWLTGRGFNHQQIAAENRLSTTALSEGQEILIPSHILLAAMKAPTPERIPVRRAAAVEAAPPAAEFDEAEAEALLKYSQDAQGAFAEYRIRRGEALYSAVILRFTNFIDHEAVQEAAGLVAKRSEIADVRDIDAGAPIRIPLDMLADRFKPSGHADRIAFEQSLKETEQVRLTLRQEVHAQDLEGVVVVLDPGHGSRDPGTMQPEYGLYEDEINYDIACRIMRRLERTGARVYCTIKDPSSGFTPVDAKRFAHDEDEVVQSTPVYPPRTEQWDRNVSLNMRYYVANAAYERERERGLDSRKMVFLSVHCDARGDEASRGAMIYLPGAKGRGALPPSDHTKQRTYNGYKEVKRVTLTQAELRRDEALSRAFAQTLFAELGNCRVQRYKTGPAIRTEIQRSRTSVFVPAVLRGTLIPTKMLLEVANMRNPTDRDRLADPEWREQVAEAFVNSLKSYYQST